MDSSSDGSFAWTDASNDTIDSVDIIVNDKMNKFQSEDESISGKSYKRKLQEELFSESNGDLQPKEQFQHKEQKRKWSNGQSDSDHVESPRKKKIKREPDSDIDVSTIKYKTNGHDLSETHQDLYDEGYLDLKVKEEQYFAAPYAIKTKQSRSQSTSNSDILNEETTKKKSKRKSKHDSFEETEIENDKLNCLVIEDNEHYDEKIKKKKKKSKNRNDSTVFDESEVQESDLEDPSCNGEIVRHEEMLSEGTPPQTTPRKKRSSNGDDRDEDKKIRKVKQTDSPMFLSDSVLEGVQKIPEEIEFPVGGSNLELETSQLERRKPPKSSKLKTFLRENSNLKTLTNKPKSECVATVDDEIWVIRCPRDVDINAFQNKDLNLEGKCKLKLNGQTYEGTVDHETDNMSILSLEQSDFVIKSLSVKGYLNLHKRIPKTHIQDDAVLNYNQTSFIPLPETKCRHPLFGSNYRKAIKLTARVTERLTSPTALTHKKTKKSKREQRSNYHENSDHSVSINSLKAEPCAEVSLKPDLAQTFKKKNKKRKHSGDLASKKNKHMKYDLESAEAWDSEQAIEDNLFNF